MQFYNPNILYGLFAVVIPLIIHLFNFKRFKKVYFSDLSFLKNVQQQTKRHSQWRHILIMILRMLAIIALVLAFAGPYIPAKDSTKAASDISFVNIFIDNSFSMEARGAEGNLLEQGRVLAREIALSYKPSDKFRLLTNNPFSFARPFVSQKLFTDQLDKVVISMASMKLADIPKRIIVDVNDNKYQELYLISDFQKEQTKLNLWQNDTLLNISLLPLIAANQGNVFVDSVWIEEPVLQVGDNVEVFFNVSNQSDRVIDDLPISLFIGNKKKSVSSVNIDAFSVIKSSFIIKMDTVGFYNAKINIQDYPIVYDDDFYFSFNVQKTIDVLCISSKSSNKDLHTFLKTDSSFNAKIINQDLINYSEFSSYSTIILNSLTSYSSGLLSELKKFIEKGKTLIIIPSSQNSIEEINTVFSKFDLPRVSYIDSVKRNIKSIDLLSNEFKDVFNTTNNKSSLAANTDLPYFKSYFKVQSESGNKSIALISNEVGSALLYRNNLLNSNIYGFYASMESKNSNFSAHAVFVPIMYNLIRNIPSSRSLSTFLGTEEEQNSNIPFNSENTKLIMKHYSDSMEFIPQYRNLHGDLLLSFSQTPNSVGSYRLVLDGKQKGVFSFNYNRSESYLDYYSANEIKGFIEKNKYSNINILDSIRSEISEQIAEVNRGVKLWKLFIILVLAFLIFEVFLLRFSK